MQEKRNGMYEKFFFLKEKPFHITPDPRFLYLGRKHGEAMDLLSYGVSSRKGFILLTGEVGTGKTTLCRAILEKLPPHTETALVLNPVLSERDLLQAITEDFGLHVAGDSVKAHIDSLNEFLLKISAEGGNAVVIIDEAQNLSPATFEMLRLLSNLETEKEKLLQIILVGQPELKAKLAMAELRQLNQRVAVRHNLDPLDIEETLEYINKRLAVAGGANSLEFTHEAVGLIHHHSGGIPRMINIICDRALTAAYIEDRRTVDSVIAQKSLDELKREGYILHAEENPDPAWNRYLSHMAISAFFIAAIAGILWGPFVFKLTGFSGTP